MFLKNDQNKKKKKKKKKNQSDRIWDKKDFAIYS